MRAGIEPRGDAAETANTLQPMTTTDGIEPAGATAPRRLPRTPEGISRAIVPDTRVQPVAYLTSDTPQPVVRQSEMPAGVPQGVPTADGPQVLPIADPPLTPAADPLQPQPEIPSQGLATPRPMFSVTPSGTVTVPMLQSTVADHIDVSPDTGLVTIAVRGAALGEVLSVLAHHRGLNIVTSEDISASVTANLQDVPFDTALTHILSVAGYTWVCEGNVLLVTSISAGTKLSPHAQGRQLRVFSLDFVSASDVDGVIQGLLSPVGQASISASDPEDNRKTQELLVVEDLPDYVQRIEQYILQVDVPPRQVLIEARVLSVKLDDDLKHGINLEYLDSLGIPSLTLKTQGFADLAKFNAGTSPAFFFNIAGSDLGTLIEALETTTDTKTLATPKVLALNGQQARIQIGQRLGYRVTTTTQTSTLENVEFLEVGIVLEVTPWITKDGQVLMEVKPKVSSGQINPDTALPDEETTEVETALMLPDGYGMVIGGLIQEEDIETQQKVPIIGDFWGVGRLFQRREVNRRRSEIIIALTPHIVPYQPVRQQLECEQYHRAQTPLLYGPLLENPRPAEPKFLDAGQRPAPRAKLQHLHPLPDSGGWFPTGSQENHVPGREFMVASPYAMPQTQPTEATTNQEPVPTPAPMPPE